MEVQSMWIEAVKSLQDVSYSKSVRKFDFYLLKIAVLNRVD